MNKKTLQLFILTYCLAFSIHGAELSGSDLLQSKSFYAKSVKIENFFGEIHVKNKIGSDIDLKIADSKPTDAAGVKIITDPELIRILGSVDKYINLEIVMDSNIPLEIELNTGDLDIDDRESATTLIFNSSTGTIQKSGVSITCTLNGTSKLIISELNGKGIFTLKGTSIVQAQNGALDSLDLTIDGIAAFDFEGNISGSFQYSISQGGVATIQSITGEKIRKHLSSDGKLYIDMIEQE